MSGVVETGWGNSERREDSGTTVGQWMGGMQRRQWRRQQEHLLGLEEQQLHLLPAHGWLSGL